VLLALRIRPPANGGLYYFLTPLLIKFVSILFWVATMIPSEPKKPPVHREAAMIEQSLLVKLAFPSQTDFFASRLRQECEISKQLFELQPVLIQQDLRTQAANIAEAIHQSRAHVQFTLPSQLLYPQTTQGEEVLETLPAKYRQQFVYQLAERWTHSDLVKALNHRLDELERSENQIAAIAAGLLQYSIAFHLIYHMLPVGKSVVYATPQGDDIPNQPVDGTQDSGYASQSTLQAADVKKSSNGADINTPYVAAWRFFMPQWVAFDEQGQLLVNNINEAEACIASMQRYMDILKSAIEIAPYMIADEVCQQKRYGMVGQLVNQGRWLARYELQEIIGTIHRRVAANNLNRGLSLNVPYFNDQTLKLELTNFEIIPKGRVMFVSAFVVLAVRAHGARVAQDSRLSLSTRRFLLSELGTLEKQFMRS
jgi:hypothetical protein